MLKEILQCVSLFHKKFFFHFRIYKIQRDSELAIFFLKNTIAKENLILIFIKKLKLCKLYGA